MKPLSVLVIGRINWELNGKAHTLNAMEMVNWDKVQVLKIVYLRMKKKIATYIENSLEMQFLALSFQAWLFVASI